MYLKLKKRPARSSALIFILSVALAASFHTSPIHAGASTVAFDNSNYNTYSDIAILNITDDDPKFVGNGQVDSIEVEITNPAQAGVDKPEVLILTEINLGPDKDKGKFRGAIGFEDAEIPCNGAIFVDDTSNQILATYLPAQFDPDDPSENTTSNVVTITSSWGDSGTAGNTHPGRIFFDQSNYVGDGTIANISMLDNDLISAGNTTQNVILTSNTDTSGITITLNQAGSLYTSTVTFTTGSSSGGTTLRVSHDDIITATYSDAIFATPADPNDAFDTAKFYSTTLVLPHISCSATRPGSDGTGLGTNTFPTAGFFTPTLAFEFLSYIGTTAQEGTRANIILTAPSSAGAGSVTVKVTGPEDTTGFDITLNETASEGGTFMGNIGFDTSASDVAQTIIKVKNGDAISASITGLSPATTIWNSSTSPSTIRFLDSTFSSDVDTVVLGDFTYIELFDADQPNSVQAVSVTVTGANGSDSESVALAKSGGIFRGQIQTRDSNITPPASGSSFLEVAVGDVISVTYQDNNPVSTATDSVTVVLPTPPASPAGTVMFDKDSYSGTADIAMITLQDIDLAAQTNQDVTITSTSDPTGVNITLSGSAGTFSGSLNFSTSTSDTITGTIQVSDNDVVTVTYNDADDGSGNPALATDTALWFLQAPNPQGQVLFDASDYSGTTAVATITLRDSDLAGGTTQIVRVTSPTDPTGIDLTLNSVNGAGNFTGNLNFSTSSSNTTTGTIQVSDNDTLTVTYNDADDGSGNSAVDTDKAIWREAPTPLGELFFDAQDYLGTILPATITLRDGDLAAGTTQTVRVTSTTDPTGIDITLNSVDGMGTFSGSLNFSTSTSDTITGTIQVSDNDVVTVTYNDADDGSGNPAVVTDTAIWHDTVFGPITSKGFIFFDRNLYLGFNDQAVITVRDLDLANDNSVAITVTSSADGRGITVSATATATAGEFQGTIRFAVDQSNPGQNLIGVFNGSSRIVATYNDADDGMGSAAVATASSVWIDSQPTSAGRMIFDKEIYEGTTDEDGTVAQITLIDSDLTDPTETILITSNTDNIGISFILPRITPSVPGVYSRTLKFDRLISVADSTIRASSGDRVRAIYQDANPNQEVRAEATWIDLRPPPQTALRRPFPNPFDPGGNPVTIGFDLRKPGNVRFVIYNILGEMIREFDLGQLRSRSYRNNDAIQWDGKNDKGRTVESGIYIGALVVRLDEGGDEVKFAKIAVVR